MSRKAVISLSVAVGVLCLAALALGVYFSQKSRLSASIEITTGNQPGRLQTSRLECKGDKAQGSGMYRFAKKAQAGCYQIKRLKESLTEKQDPCPKKQQGGERTLSLKGEIEGEPIYFEQRNQLSCPGRISQLAKITPFIETALAAPPKPSFIVIIDQPPPPVLDAKAQQEAIRQSKKPGAKQYQRKLEEKLNKLKKGNNLKPCKLPLPEVYVTCYIQITFRPNENEREALTRVQRENPDWFSNSQKPTIQDSNPGDDNIDEQLTRKQIEKLQQRGAQGPQAP